MFGLTNWLLLHVKQYKNCCWRSFVIRKCIYLDSAGRWSDDKVAMYLLTYNQQTYWSQQTNEQPKVIQEVVSPEVSKLNYAVMNKKQWDQMQFSLKKKD